LQFALVLKLAAISVAMPTFSFGSQWPLKPIACQENKAIVSKIGAIED